MGHGDLLPRGPHGLAGGATAPGEEEARPAPVEPPGRGGRPQAGTVPQLLPHRQDQRARGPGGG
ncbi:hypothetical protein C3V41_00920 [Actinomyces sp. oral taxon 897]|nr:hypothetical protein C3V41_00920 [Actinomyces sp. oral taxon 897]